MHYHPVPTTLEYVTYAPTLLPHKAQSAPTICVRFVLCLSRFVTALERKQNGCSFTVRGGIFDYYSYYDHHRSLYIICKKQLGFCVKSNGSISVPFFSHNGCPQGDPMSPLLFNIFVSDLPNCLLHDGINLNNVNIKYIQYADDLVILAACPHELQKSLDSLANFCINNNLTINIKKSKCLTFYKGRYSLPNFFLNNTPLDDYPFFFGLFSDPIFSTTLFNYFPVIPFYQPLFHPA
ncbi:RNA-directed DNA polymerase from mobile element jockey [Nymphon striatum]|nr:RNA-directed DNA polymerase from mobile element jockey [Nymphon striatum]